MKPENLEQPESLYYHSPDAIFAESSKRIMEGVKTLSKKVLSAEGLALVTIGVFSALVLNNLEKTGEIVTEIEKTVPLLPEKIMAAVSYFQEAIPALIKQL